MGISEGLNDTNFIYLNALSLFMDGENTQEKGRLERKRPSDAVERFVYDMVESSKKPFEPGKPNECKEDINEIEALTKRIKDKLQRS